MFLFISLSYRQLEGMMKRNMRVTSPSVGDPNPQTAGWFDPQADNTNESDRGALVKVSEKRIATNRANAKKSTGPKTAAGKLAVAKNGIAHGAFALIPVIEDVESALDWKRYREAMLASLAPVGMLETSLAERIILTAWRQRRATRYEAEQIRLTQANAPEIVGTQLGLERGTASQAVAEILSDAAWRQHTWQTVQHFADASDETTLSQEDAENLLWHVHDQFGLKDAFDDYWQPLPEPEMWTVGMVRQLVRALAEQHGKGFDELLAAVKDKALTEWAQSGLVASQVKLKLDEYRRENLLPDNETLEKVMRYEAHLSRLFHRDLHELQRLQAMRLGQPVAAPIAIDVDVTSGRNLTLEKRTSDLEV